MPINGYARLDKTTDDDLDVPAFLKPDYVPTKMIRTLPAEVISPDVPTTDDVEDDVAPGVIEYRPVRRPVLYRAGSTAMVVAATTGRVVGLSARAARTAGRWFGHGTWATAILGYRYVRAHDHIEALGGMNGPGWRKVVDTRNRRWKTLGWTTGAVAGVDLGAWWALVKFGGLTALDWSWAVAPGFETLAAGTMLTLYGRYRLTAGLAPGQIIDPADADTDPDEPFPLAWCQDGGQVRECVSRALHYEGIDTRRIDILGHRGWGWEIDIDLKGATPGKVQAVADQLDTHFDIARGATMIEPDTQRSAHIMLRLRTSDPFADMPTPQIHAPNSLDVADEVNLGLSMDGSGLNVVLEGTRILVIGVSGSAKSTGVLRDVAEAITASHNAIALDLDPVKDGLREFEGVMAVPPIRGNKACEVWLGHLVAMAEARNVVRNRLNMGDTWVATATHPAIFPIVDEFIYLSKAAKELFIMLLRLGRQTGIYPVAAGQDATSDSLGDAIADSFTLRVMLASRHADIPLVLGSGAIAAGWRPDRLQPAQNKHIRNDAGRSYVMGAGLDRPILYGWNEISRDSIKRAVADRVAAGRPWFDHETLAEAKLLHLASEYGPAAVALSVADRLDELARRADSPEAAQVAGLLRMFDRRGVSFLPTAVIVDAGLVADGAKLQALLVRLVPMAKSAKEYVDGKQVRGWERSVAEQAAAALIAPS